jgi:hypothetical protein
VLDSIPFKVKLEDFVPEKKGGISTVIFFSRPTLGRQVRPSSYARFDAKKFRHVPETAEQRRKRKADEVICLFLLYLYDYLILFFTQLITEILLAIFCFYAIIYARFCSHVLPIEPL